MSARRAAQHLGRLGGIARARRLSGIHKRAIASLGGQARRQSKQYARRIAENLQYSAAVEALRRPPKVISTHRSAAPLPNAKRHIRTP